MLRLRPSSRVSWSACACDGLCVLKDASCALWRQHNVRAHCAVCAVAHIARAQIPHGAHA